MVAAFTNHLTVCLRIKLEAGLPQRGRGLYKMYTKVLNDTTNSSRFVQVWTIRRLQKKKPGQGYVGEIYVERKIRFIFVQEVTARTR